MSNSFSRPSEHSPLLRPASPMMSPSKREDAAFFGGAAGSTKKEAHVSGRFGLAPEEEKSTDEGHKFSINPKPTDAEDSTGD